MERSIIDIVKYEFGMTTKEAKAYINNASYETLKALEKAYKDNTKKSFYED